MPAKKGPWKGQIKKKKLQTTTLMKISLKVDGHVYENRIIPVKDAEAYLKEITSLNIGSLKDARINQVADKLTRVMKSIIREEHSNSGYEGEDINNYCENYCTSPVYSLPDTDRTLSRIIFEHEMRIHSQTTEEAISNNSIVVDNTKENTIVTNETHAIDENIDINNTCPAESELVRVISDLSMKDDKPIVNSSNDYSQNILDGYQIHLSSNTVDDEQETANDIRNVENNYFTRNNTDSLNKMTCNNTLKERANFNPNGVIPNYTEQGMSSNTVDYNKNKFVSGMDHGSHSATEAPKLLQKRRKKHEEAIIKKQNKTKEIDLSWIKNIKFVRRIDNKEYEKIDIAETFWRNCELPTNLDSWF